MAEQRVEQRAEQRVEPSSRGRGRGRRSRWRGGRVYRSGRRSRGRDRGLCRWCAGRSPHRGERSCDGATGSGDRRTNRRPGRADDRPTRAADRGTRCARQLLSRSRVLSRTRRSACQLRNGGAYGARCLSTSAADAACHLLNRACERGGDRRVAVARARSTRTCRPGRRTHRTCRSWRRTHRTCRKSGRCTRWVCRTWRRTGRRPS
jgi:hypothetical protein